MTVVESPRSQLQILRDLHVNSGYEYPQELGRSCENYFAFILNALATHRFIDRFQKTKLLSRLDTYAIDFIVQKGHRQDHYFQIKAHAKDAFAVSEVLYRRTEQTLALPMIDFAGLVIPTKPLAYFVLSWMDYPEKTYERFWKIIKKTRYQRFDWNSVME